MAPLRAIAGRLTADEVIDRLVPYLVALFTDESAQVRAASFELLVQVVRHAIRLTAKIAYMDLPGVSLSSQISR